jgi:predicted deacylase
MTFIRWGFAATLVFAAPLAGQVTPLTIGKVTAAPGTRASGFLEVAAGVDSGTRIPVTIIRGSQPGPSLALVGGTHGSEVAPIVALQRLRSLVNPAELRGTLIIVHVANMPSFLGRTIYYSPVDRKNLNRMYPGNPAGTVSERIANVITTEIIERADYLIDMHSGDGNESLRPYLYWNRLGVDAKVDSLARELALAWGATHVIVDTTRTRDREKSLYTQNTAHLRGKPALTTETGYLGLPDPLMVQQNVDGALRVLRHLRMLPGNVETGKPVWLGRYEVLTSPETGVWHHVAERGHTVAEGAIIGRLTDFFGDEIAVIRAPFDGEVMYVVGTPAMNKGEPVAMVARK